MSLSRVLLLLCLQFVLTSLSFAQAKEPLSKTRALLEKKGVVLVREYSAPITLDMKNNAAVEISGYAFQIDGDLASKQKGLRVRIKHDPKGMLESIGYLDLNESEAFSAALGQMSALSVKWLEAKRKGNADAEFASVDGIAVGFYVDQNGDHQGYFSSTKGRVMFAMSPTLIMTVKSHIDKFIVDLKRV